MSYVCYRTGKFIKESFVESLWYNDYSNYLMKETELPICNGEMLLAAMEKNLYWEDFLNSVGIVEA